jgi:predicted nucleotidyltransferase
MTTSQKILSTLTAVKSELAIFKVLEIGVFGSVIRGEQNDSSDMTCWSLLAKMPICWT